MERGHVFLRILGFCVLFNLASSNTPIPVPVTTTDQIDQGLRNGITSLCANWCTRQDIEDMCRTRESQDICDERLPKIVDEYFCSSNSCLSGNSCFAPMSFVHATSQPLKKCIPTDVVDAAEAYGAGNYVEYRRALAVADSCKDWCSYAEVKEPTGTLDDALSWYFCKRVDPDYGWNRCKLDITSVAADKWAGITASQCIQADPTSPVTSPTTRPTSPTTSPTTSSTTRKRSSTTDQTMGIYSLSTTTTPHLPLTPPPRGPNTTAAPQGEAGEDVTVKGAAGAVAALAVVVAVGTVAAVYCRRKRKREKADQQLRTIKVELPSIPPRPKKTDKIPHIYRIHGQINNDKKPSKQNELKPRAKANNYVHVNIPNKGNQYGPPANPRPPVPHDDKIMKSPLKKIESAPPKPTPGLKNIRKRDPKRASDPANKRVDVDIDDTETIYLDVLRAYTPLDSVATHVRGPKLPPR